MTHPAISQEAAWRKAVAAVLGGAGPESLETALPDGLRLRPLYPRSQKDEAPLGRAAQPWQIGIRLDRPALSDIRAYAKGANAESADLLVIVPADSPFARGQGVSGFDAPSLCSLLDDLDPHRHAIRLEQAPGRSEFVGGLIQAISRGRLAPAAWRIDLGLNPLEQSPGDLVPLLRQLREAGFQGQALMADGRAAHDAGGGPAIEIAAVAGALAVALRQLGAAGWDSLSAAGGVSAVLAADSEQFITIAKFRAMRLVWARLIEAAGCPPVPLRLHAETSWRMMTLRDPWTNVLRMTIAGLAASLGGADALTLLPHDLAAGAASEDARRLARNTQAVLRDESHLWRVQDPARGSGLFDDLTQDMARAAWLRLRALEAKGGLALPAARNALDSYIATETESRRRVIAEAARPILGTSLYPDPQEAAPTSEPGDNRDSSVFEALWVRFAAIPHAGRRIMLVQLDAGAESTAARKNAAGLLAVAGISPQTRIPAPTQDEPAFRASILAECATAAPAVLCLCGSADRLFAPGDGVFVEWSREAMALGVGLMVAALPAQPAPAPDAAILIHPGCDIPDRLGIIADHLEGK